MCDAKHLQTEPSVSERLGVLEALSETVTPTYRCSRVILPCSLHSFMGMGVSWPLFIHTPAKAMRLVLLIASLATSASTICTNDCECVQGHEAYPLCHTDPGAWVGDGACDDGGPNSSHSICRFGTACPDRGLRLLEPPSPPMPPPNPPAPAPPATPPPPASPPGASMRLCIRRADMLPPLGFVCVGGPDPGTRAV